MPDLARLSEAKQKLFEMQRLGKLAPQPAQSVAVAAPVARKRESIAPMSLAQEQVWLRDQYATAKARLYNESITVKRSGPLDIAALEKSLAEVVRRHEIWRTTLDKIDGQPVQVIHPAAENFHLPAVDLRHLPKHEREAEALRIATAEAELAFDVKTGPLLRVTLVTLDDEDHRLFLTAHQSTIDGVSVFEVFPTELTALYAAFAAGKESPLAPLPMQYADFALWQRQWLAGSVLEEQMHYWQEQFAVEPQVLRWPAKRPPEETFRGALLPFDLSRQLTGALRELGQREGITLYAVLLAGFGALLSHYSGQDDIIIGTVAPAGRKRAEFQKLLGYFLNPVPLRLDLSGDPNFTSLLRRAQKTTMGAISHDDVPLEHLARKFISKPDPSRHPFFQNVISLAPSLAPLPAGWSMTPMDVESGGARWDLYLELSDRPEGALGRAQYNPDIYDPSAMKQLLADFEKVLQRAAKNPESKLSAILTAAFEKN